MSDNYEIEFVKFHILKNFVDQKYKDDPEFKKRVDEYVEEKLRQVFKEES